MSTSALRRRLAGLERQCRHAVQEAPVTAVALGVGGGNWAWRGSECVPCPDAARLLAESPWPIKMYLGFDPGVALCGPKPAPG
jgi:hypothetical protein